MLSIADKEFLAMCMLYSVGEEIKGRNEKEYFTINGFLDFYNGNHRYVIRDCAATRKYLETRGYTYNPSHDFKIAHYTYSHVNDVLKEKGPGSYEYRKMVSFFADPGRQRWDKLDKLDSFEEIHDGIVWLFNNDPYLGLKTGGTFLRSIEGKISILDYAQYNGFDYYSIVYDNLKKKGFRDVENTLSSQFEEGLKTIPYEFFENILREVEEKKRSSGYSDSNSNYHR